MQCRGRARRRCLARELYGAVIRAVRRLDGFGLGRLLSTIPDSNDDFVLF